MTDQKQASERIWSDRMATEINTVEGGRCYIEFVRKDLYEQTIYELDQAKSRYDCDTEALAKQRDELAAELSTFTNSVQERERDFALKMGKLEARAEKAEAERDELKQELFTFTNSVRKRERELRVQLDQALAASAAREITRLRALAEQENNNG